jgi:toxin-antitoxin system PIN domain toxin
VDRLLASDDWIGLPWTTIWGFVRIVTNKKSYPRPITGTQAMGVIRTWLDSPRVVTVDPGPRHLELLARFVESEGATGNLTPDAVIAALAIEQGATVASTDNDFRRFGVRWVNPSEAS